MSCTQSSYSTYSSSGSAPSAPPNSAALTSGTLLIVSNSPETITSTSLQDVYAFSTSLASGDTPFRFWAWHLNSSGSSLTLALRAKLSTGTGSATSLKHAKVTDNDLEAAGKCLAMAQLAQTFDGTDSDASLSTTGTNVGSWSVGTGDVLGVLYQGTFSLDQAATLYVWVEISSGTWGDYPGSITDVSDGHVRGWWPGCKAVMSCSGFNANPPVPGVATQKVGVCEDEGPEVGSGVFGWQGSTLDPYGVANVGCYGADLEYDVPITNNGTQAFPCYMYAVARNNGGESHGAISTNPSEGSGLIGLPPIQYYSATGNRDVAPISCDSSGDSTFFSVAVGGISGGMKVSVVTGGAASLPFNLLFSGIGVAKAEGGE